MYVRMRARGVASAIRERFIHKLLYFIQFAKVTTRESFRLYGTCVAEVDVDLNLQYAQ